MKHILNFFISIFCVFGIFVWLRWAQLGVIFDNILPFVIFLLIILFIEFLYYFHKEAIE
jgi:hypothetical protein